MKDFLTPQILTAFNDNFFISSIWGALRTHILAHIVLLLLDSKSYSGL